MKKLILLILVLLYTPINADTKWKIPSSKTCKHNGADMYGKTCFSNKFIKAKKICSSQGYRLPTLIELQKLMTDCGGKIAGNKEYDIMNQNSENSTYISCLEKKGLSDMTYWTIDKQELWFYKGTTNLRGLTGNVVCLNSPIDEKSSKSNNISHENQNNTSNNDVSEGEKIIGGLILGGLVALFSGGDDDSLSYNSSSSSSNIKYVQVKADCINGLFPCIEKNLQITGGTGRFEPSYNQASMGTIYKDYQGNTAGTYNFSVQFDDTICTGNFYISGKKENYTIALGKDCQDNGSNEW